jgi:endothelin-converting enzyme/putative endopeptidase
MLAWVLMIKQLKNSLKLGVGGLGLPDQDYYISEDKDTKEKNLYEAYR